MKTLKLIGLMVIAVIFFTSTAQADLKLPPTSAGAYYSLKENAINHMETFEAVKYKAISLEFGYAGDVEETNHQAVLALSADIEALQLKKYLQLPILDLIAFRPAIVAGFGNIDFSDLAGGKFDYGIGATIIKYQF